MGIRFLCPSCGKRINVKEQQAGLRGFCPKCGAGVDIPLESTIASRRERSEQEATTLALAERARANAAATAAAEAMIDPLLEIPAALWYALPPGAAKPYGPIDGAGLSQWIDENRLTPDSMVWREDWPEWRSVASVWPKLSARNAPLRPKAAQVQTVAPPPVLARSGAAARANSEPATAASVGSKKGGEVPGPAIGSAMPAGGVYYRRRSNSAYLTTVVILLLVVVALGAVMIWVVMRDPPPSKPKEKTDAATPSSTGAKLPPLENPTYKSPTGFPSLPKASASPTPNGSSPASTATGS